MEEKELQNFKYHVKNVYDESSIIETLFKVKGMFESEYLLIKCLIPHVWTCLDSSLNALLVANGKEAMLHSHNLLDKYEQLPQSLKDSLNLDESLPKNGKLYNYIRYTENIMPLLQKLKDDGYELYDQIVKGKDLLYALESVQQEVVKLCHLHHVCL